MDKVIQRGYVKWIDKEGVFHKEPLFKHPEMLAKATDEQKVAAEEVKVSIEQAEKFYAERDKADEETVIQAPTPVAPAKPVVVEKETEED